MTERESWDAYFFRVAARVSERATCPRAAIGAVLVKQKRILGTGYNGAKSGEEHCPDDAEHRALITCDRSVHAEVNALTNAFGNPYGATLYVVGPRRICPDCADRLREQGVTDIRWRESVPTLEGVLAEVNAWQAETFPHATSASARSNISDVRSRSWPRPNGHRRSGRRIPDRSGSPGVPGRRPGERSHAQNSPSAVAGRGATGRRRKDQGRQGGHPMSAPPSTSSNGGPTRRPCRRASCAGRPSRSARSTGSPATAPGTC
jgi:dCMP deaminase